MGQSAGNHSLSLAAAENSGFWAILGIHSRLDLSELLFRGWDFFVPIISSLKMCHSSLIQLFFISTFFFFFTIFNGLAWIGDIL